jgi:hypothetical protein
VRPLLGEGGVVDHEHRVRAGERGGQVGAVAAEDGLVVPRAVADELLEGLLGVLAGQPVGQGDAVGEGLDALAVAVGRQAVQVHPGPPGGPGLGEVGGEQGRVVAESVEDGGVEVGGVRLHTRFEAGTRRLGPGF